MLAGLKQVERDGGRRGGRRWGPRGLDLAIILWSGGVWGSAGLVVPHPEFRRRRFVLEPLAEIAPHAVHPVFKRSVRSLLAALAH